ncbi:MAG: hypothetical protein RLZZ450_7627 [Pseudomonadota bacterium]|jgi:hypothetical protein
MMSHLARADDFTQADLEQLAALVVKLGRAVIASGDAAHAMRESAKKPRRDEVEYLTTAQAARVLNTTAQALHAHVQRGSLKPDVWGGRGAFKAHRFTRDTLAAFATRKSHG